MKRRDAKGKEERGRYTQPNAEFQRIARRVKKVLSEQCKETEEDNRMVKTKISSKILKIPKEHFMQRWAQ